MTDTELLDWLEANRATVEFLEYWPSGELAHRWWIATEGVNPRTAKTLREAIRAAKHWRERTLELKANNLIDKESAASPETD